MAAGPRGRSRRPVVTLIALLAALLLGGAASAAYLFYFRPVAEAVAGATGQVVPRPVVESSEPGQPDAPGSSAAAKTAPVPTPPSLTGNTPVNVLLLGSDTDAKFGGAYNTQIMIVVSIVPSQKKVTMLSIPRDLWVQVPGYGANKIGSAHGIGGVALARETIEKDFGIPIHYYAWVGLDGFVKVIDTLGGVDLDVGHPVVDDSYPDDVGTTDPYAYRRLYMPAGLQHLDGTRTLEYVRSRHGDLIGDFGRSQRQQQVLDALRSKTSAKEIIARLPQLATDLKDSVRTDMTLQDLARFAGFADQIRSEPVQQLTLIPPKYSSYATTGDGQAVVIPDWRQIRPLVDSTFGLKTASTLPMTVPALGFPPAPIPAAKPIEEAEGTPGPEEKLVPPGPGTPTVTGGPPALVPTLAAKPPAASGAPAAAGTPAASAGAAPSASAAPAVVPPAPAPQAPVAPAPASPGPSAAAKPSTGAPPAPTPAVKR